MGFTHYKKSRDSTSAICGMQHEKMKWTIDPRKATCPQCRGVILGTKGSSTDI